MPNRYCCKQDSHDNIVDVTQTSFTTMPELKKPQEHLLFKNRLANLKLLLEQVSAAWTVDNYKSLLQIHVKILPRLLDAERCTIYIIELGTDNICSVFGTGLSEKQITPPREGSIVGEVISTGKGVIANNLDTRPGYHRLVAEETGYVTRNMVCVPIKSVTNRGVAGAVQVLNKKNGVFVADDLGLLEELAATLSISIESIILNKEILRLSSQLNREVERIDEEYPFDHPFVAESPAMQKVLDLVGLVGNSPVNVLILGENGTGKELVARLIHESSERRDRPLVAVNCASIPESLAESEFFGYEKGAFTGAIRSRKGRFEEASGGTILLDEIADMPLAIQPKVLRAIQEGEGSRLGSNKIVSYDLRIISATNKDLKKEVEAGRFREDLYFRLFSVEIVIPPLRERPEDILPMAAAFLAKICRRFQKKLPGFSPEVLKVFSDYAWPGNVRQLHSEIERLVALTPPGEYIRADKCTPELLRGKRIAATAGSTGLSMPAQTQALEIDLINKALEQSNGNRARAAVLLGISRQGLHKKMKRYRLAGPEA
ncbi:MAG: hypothetical protein A2521_10505 [Deltaproteobacteria bacterium RIFOXYD12_FULL_57_12]|nr:MAG: hypothetical protein A2521_10505 [Deltaproteobacteria bacterium RIFOXYD12_FULL_57_12]